MAGGRKVGFAIGLVALVSGCGGGEMGATGVPFSDLARCPTSGPPAPASAPPADEGIEGVYVLEAREGAVALVDDECHEYESFPPADGPMAATWANCGFYDDPIPPSHAVRSLHNGAVWIAYGPEVGREAREVIRATATRSSHVLASPVDDLPAPIVLTAWQRQLPLAGVDDPRFDEFVSAYLFAPHRPVLYASCRDGRGVPVASFWDGATS